MVFRLPQLRGGSNLHQRAHQDAELGSCLARPLVQNRRFSSCSQAYLDRCGQVHARFGAGQMLHPAPLTNPRYNCSILPMLSGQRVQHPTSRCKLTSVPPSVAGTSLTECPPSQPTVSGTPSCDEEELPSGSSIPSPSIPSVNNPSVNNTPNPSTTSTSSSSSSSAPHGNSQPSSPPDPHQASPPLPYATSQAASQSPPSNSQAGPATSTPPPAPPPQSTPSPSISSSSGFQIQPLHILLFTLIFVGGAIFATMTIQFTADVNFNVAAQTVVRRVAKSMAFRQLCIISGAILVVRFGLNNLFHMLARFAPNAVPWEKTKLYYVLREVSVQQQAWAACGYR